MNAPRDSFVVRDLVAVFVGLMALLILSAATVLLPPAPWKTPVGLLIAAAKTTLIASFFMKLRSQRGLIRVAAAAGLFWLMLFGVLLFSDYLTRGWR